jgi:TonB family protein
MSPRIGASDVVGAMPEYVTSVRIEGPKEKSPSGILVVPNVYPTPEYPPDFRRAGVGGQVDLSFIVKRDGCVASITVERSTGRKFDASAAKAVSQWKFEPREVAGRPIPNVTPMTVTGVFAAFLQKA